LPFSLERLLETIGSLLLMLLLTFLGLARS
jgi:hypothetical protein